MHFDTATVASKFDSWLVSRERQGSASDEQPLLYGVSGHNRIFQSWERAMVALRATPEADSVFAHDEAGIQAFRIVCTKFVCCGSEWPRPRELPVLRSLKGHPADLAHWAFDRPSLDAMWFLGGRLQPTDSAKLTVCTSCLRSLRISAPDFVSLARATPTAICTLCHLVLDEDLTWSDFTLLSDEMGLGGSSLASACSLIENNEREEHSLKVEGRRIVAEVKREPSYVGCSRPPALESGERLVHLAEMCCRLFVPKPVCTPKLRKKRVRPTEAKPVEIEWATQAEASWTAMVAELDTVETTAAVESDEEKQRLQERQDGMDQAWDYLLSRVLDTMRELERRRWLREQEELEERENFASRLASGSDTCLVNDYENGKTEYLRHLLDGVNIEQSGESDDEEDESSDVIKTPYTPDEAELDTVIELSSTAQAGDNVLHSQPAGRDYLDTQSFDTCGTNVRLGPALFAFPPAQQPRHQHGHLQRRAAATGALAQAGANVKESTPSLSERSIDSARAGGTIPVDIHVGERSIDGACVAQGALAGARIGGVAADPNTIAMAMSWGRQCGGEVRCDAACNEGDPAALEVQAGAEGLRGGVQTRAAHGFGA
ncbi:hypothetical protein B0H14DRAFT_3548179 [Mycena olivaceomarginata]|nr:hypothetical protein B0H14DRAFT_3548179 [Mycena olivaceomarginata]